MDGGMEGAARHDNQHKHGGTPSFSSSTGDKQHPTALVPVYLHLLTHAFNERCRGDGGQGGLIHPEPGGGGATLRPLQQVPLMSRKH